MDRSKVPAVLSIAGSDSSGGAGIQADIKTITAHRLYAETAITAITAQNTLGVTAVQNISPDIVAAQIDAVFDDIRPNAVKIGMVSSTEIIEVIADRLSAWNAANVVVDPVRAYWAAYDVPRHLWHFTPGTIQQFGSKHGFIMAERHPMPFDAFYVSMLTEKHMRHSCTFLRGMVTGTLAWFSALVKKERSSSMIYVFRKKG